MEKSHFSTDSLTWVKSYKPFKQVDLELVQLWSMGDHWSLLEFWEGCLHLRQFQGIGPVAFVRCSQNFEDLEDLIDFAISSEQRFVLSHFSKNATSAPDIHS